MKPLKLFRETRGIAQRRLVAVLCAVLAGALLCSPVLGAALPQEGAAAEGEGAQDRDGTGIDSDGTGAGDVSGSAPAPASKDLVSPLGLPLSPSSIEVLINGEPCEPGEYECYGAYSLEVRITDEHSDLVSGDAIVALYSGGASGTIALDQFVLQGNRVYAYKEELHASSELTTAIGLLGGARTWKIELLSGPPQTSGSASKLIYGETRPAIDINSGFNKDRRLQPVRLNIDDGSGAYCTVNASTGQATLPSDYSIDAHRTVNVYDYLRLDASVASDGYNNIVALAPTEGTVTRKDPVTGTETTHSFSIVLNLKLSRQSEEVVVYRAHLYFQQSNVNTFLFGSDILYQANQSGFLAGNIIAMTSLGGTQGAPVKALSELRWSISEVFSDPSKVISYSGAITQYPALATGPHLSWGAGAGINPAHAGKIICEQDSLPCAFAHPSAPKTTDLFRDINGRALTEDAPTGWVWSRTPEVKFDPVSGYSSFALAGSLDPSGEMLGPPVAGTMPVSGASGLFATNSASAQREERCAVIIDTIRFDGDRPYLKEIGYEAAAVTGGGLRGYTGDTTVTLVISDAPAQPAPGSTSSGISSIGLTYQGIVYSFTDDYLRDPVDGSAPETVTASVPLPASDSRYTLADFELTITDIAGNATVMSLADFYQQSGPDKVTAIIVDDTAPEATLVFDNNDARNGRYYNADRTATIVITEAHFDAIQQVDPKRSIATITVIGRSQPLHLTADLFTSDDGKTWSCRHDFDEDGYYGIRVDFADFLNHPLKDGPAGESFVIDKTAPVLLVAFNNEDAYSPFYYNAPRLATVSVTERNFDAGLVSVATTAVDASGTALAAPGTAPWQSGSGDRHETSVYFGSELHYTLTADAMDLAGNTAETVVVPEFVIDMTRPAITIENVEDTQAIAGAVTPRVTFFDSNLEDYAATVQIRRASGEPAYRFRAEASLSATTKVLDYADLEAVLENDDVYILTARITDKAGNEAEETIAFSVNRFGSNYLFSPGTQDMSGAFLAAPEDVVVTEVNVSGLQSRETVVRVSAGGGVVSLRPGDDYAIEAALDDALWSNNTYTLPALLFEGDGFYRVMFRSVDRAGNLSENTMDAKNVTRDATAELAFAVDATAPLGSLSGVDDYGIYNEQSIEAQFLVSDNIAFDHARVLIDGEEAVRYTAEDIETTHSGTVTIPEADHAQDVVLEVVDRAGNTTVIEKGEVFVSSDLLTLVLKTPLARWLGISPLAGLALGAAIVALAAAAFLLLVAPYRRRRKREQMEAGLTFRTGV